MQIYCSSLKFYLIFLASINNLCLNQSLLWWLQEGRFIINHLFSTIQGCFLSHSFNWLVLAWTQTSLFQSIYVLLISLYWLSHWLRIFHESLSSQLLRWSQKTLNAFIYFSFLKQDISGVSCLSWTLPPPTWNQHFPENSWFFEQARSMETKAGVISGLIIRFNASIEFH